MFSHIRKWLPWLERERRKKEFLNKLKGTSLIHIRKNAPVGAVFVVFNHNTGDMNTFCNINTNKWACFGSDTLTAKVYSKRSLEMHLTKQIQEAGNENLIQFISDGGYIEKVKIK